MVESFIEAVEMGKIYPHPENPRDNDKAVPYVMESILKFSYIELIVVDENYVILAGDTRYKALHSIWEKSGEYTTFSVIKVTGLSDEQKIGYRIADNKTAEKADWSIPELANQASLIQHEFNLLKLGFSKKELNILLDENPISIEEAPIELPVEIRVGTNSFRVSKKDYDTYHEEYKDHLGGKTLFEFLLDDMGLNKLRRRFELQKRD